MTRRRQPADIALPQARSCDVLVQWSQVIEFAILIRFVQDLIVRQTSPIVAKRIFTCPVNADHFPTPASRLRVKALSLRRFSCPFLSGNPRIGHAKSGAKCKSMASPKSAHRALVTFLLTCCDIFATEDNGLMRPHLHLPINMHPPRSDGAPGNRDDHQAPQ